MAEQTDIDIHLDQVYIEYPDGTLKLAKITPSWEIYDTEDDTEENK